MAVKLVHLNAKRLLEDQLAKSIGLDKYADIIRKAKDKDVSGDAEFQKAFNAFYRVRRNSEWRKCYYNLFERAKKEQYSFADILGWLYEETGNVEASFSSKMIATINPDKPIWDQYVLKSLGLELKGKTSSARVSNAIKIYDSIEQWYKDYFLTEEARENILEFDKWLPSYNWISATKKIDYLLWSNRY